MEKDFNFESEEIPLDDIFDCNENELITKITKDDKNFHNIKNENLELSTIKTFENKYKEKIYENGWTNIAKLPDKLKISNPIQINNDTFIVATNMYERDNPLYPGIWLYNVNHKCWKYLNKYDENIINVNIYNAPIISYNQNKCILYLYSHGTLGDESIFFGLNIFNNSYIIYDKNEKLEFYEDSSMLFVNDCLHFIGILTSIDSNNEYLQHIIWDFNRKDLKIVHTFENYRHMSGIGVIHLKERNQFMLSGGAYQDENCGYMYTESDDILLFDLNTFEWNELNNFKLPKKLSYHSCIVSNDQTYTIIINGRDENGRNSNNIYILDFELMKWTQSKIITPFHLGYGYSTPSILFDISLSSFGLNFGLNMNVFLNGYLRKYEIYNIYIPNDITNIIKKMYDKKIIHLLQCNEYVNISNHFCINFENIF